jgi:ABC-2 type transport system ATP-binding protein
VLDEPTVGLDPIQIRGIRALIESLAHAGREGEGQTVILSTHILNEVEALCDRVVLIHRGEMALDRPLAELTAGGESLEEVFTRVSTRDIAHPGDVVGARAEEDAS